MEIAFRAMKSTDRIDFAVERMAIGNMPIRSEVRTGGRPLIRYDYPDGLYLTRSEMELATKKVATLGKQSQKEIAKAEKMKAISSAPTVLTPEDLVTFARSGVPSLLERAHRLAMHSEDIKAILLVAKELADRGYGKAVQGVTVHLGDDINQAWRDLGVIEEAEEDENTQGN